MMKTAFAAAAAAVLGFTTPVSAASLCNCCGPSTVQSCAATCGPVKLVESQCVAAVNYEDKPEIGAGINPLYDVPLRNVWLNNSSRAQLEVFRALLESARRGAEADRKRALASLAKGKIEATEAGRLAKRYDNALVNYYLGIQSYRMSRSTTN